LGRLLLKGEVTDGQTVHVDYDYAGGELKFTVKPRAADDSVVEAEFEESASAA